MGATNTNVLILFPKDLMISYGLVIHQKRDTRYECKAQNVKTFSFTSYESYEGNTPHVIKLVIPTVPQNYLCL